MNKVRQLNFKMFPTNEHKYKSLHTKNIQLMNEKVTLFISTKCIQGVLTKTWLYPVSQKRKSSRKFLGGLILMWKPYPNFIPLRPATTPILISVTWGFMWYIIRIVFYQSITSVSIFNWFIRFRQIRCYSRKNKKCALINIYKEINK